MARDMMKRNKYQAATVSLFALAVGFSPIAVQAQNTYVGISLSGVNYDRDNVTRSILPPSKTTDATQVFAEDGGPRPDQIADVNEDLHSFTVKVGHSINRLLAVEVRAGFGVSEAELDDYAEDKEALTGQVPGGGTTLNTFTVPKDATLLLNNFYGLYTRVGGDDASPFVIGVFSPYVLVGYERATFEASIDGGTGGGTLEGLSFGAGFNVSFNEDSPIVLNVEWREQKERDLDGVSRQLKFTSISAGFDYRF